MFFQSTAIVILLVFYGCYYMKLKIAFLQLLPGAAIEDNIEKGIKACREAREKGADIALFPEMWSSGYVFPHDEEWLKKNSVSLDSAYVKRFSGLARKISGWDKSWKSRFGRQRSIRFAIPLRKQLFRKITNGKRRINPAIT